jgi:predicted KAP-like P-loop ATPase
MPDNNGSNNVNSRGNAYFSDAPLENPAPEFDKLKRYPFATRVAETIVSLRDPSSIAIGIYGAWGDGKTTTLKFIEHRLAELNKEGVTVIHFWFNPWRFQDESNLLLSFFQTFAEALEHPPSSIKGKLSVKLSKLKEPILEYMKRLSFISIPIGPIQFSPADLAKELLGERSSIELEELKKSIEEQLTETRVRIVVFMDDIDRLDTTEIQMLFKLVKLTANFPYTVYVLAFDDEMVANALETAYPKTDLISPGGRSSGHAFIEKIIQVPLQLPQATRLSLLILYLDGIKRVLSDVHLDLTDREWNQFQTHFQEGLFVSIKTPRMFTRYANTLAFALPLLKDEVNPSDLMLVEGIRVFYPTLYQLIKNNRSVFLGTLLDAEFYDKEAKSRTENDCREIIEDVLKPYTREQQNSARNLLLTLFPRLASILSTAGFYSDQDKEQWVKEKRIATKEYFERYFVYTIPLLDISDKEIDEFILNTKDFAIEEIYAKITEFVSAAGLVDFMSKLALRIHDLSVKEKLPYESLVTLVIATSRLGNIAPETERVYSNSIANIWFGLLKLISSSETRFEVARAVAQEIEPIMFTFECFKTVCVWNHKESEILFSNEERIELCGIIVGRIKQLAERLPTYIQFPKYAPFFLRMWSRVGTREETDEYLKRTLEENPQNVFSLIRSCLLDGHETQELSDVSLEIHTLTDCELITSVVDAGIVRATLRKIYRHLASGELKKQLPDSYEERTAHKFEQCCRTLEKNEGGYSGGNSTIYE